MSIPTTPASAPSRRDLRPAQVPTAPSGDVAAAVDQDSAVEFLRSIAPPSAAERTRAFAALLRALTTEATR